MNDEERAKNAMRKLNKNIEEYAMFNRWAQHVQDPHTLSMNIFCFRYCGTVWKSVEAMRRSLSKNVVNDPPLTRYAQHAQHLINSLCHPERATQPLHVTYGLLMDLTSKKVRSTTFCSLRDQYRQHQMSIFCNNNPSMIFTFLPFDAVKRAVSTTNPLHRSRILHAYGLTDDMLRCIQNWWKESPLQGSHVGEAQAYVDCLFVARVNPFRARGNWIPCYGSGHRVLRWVARSVEWRSVHAVRVDHEEVSHVPWSNTLDTHPSGMVLYGHQCAALRFMMERSAKTSNRWVDIGGPPALDDASRPFELFIFKNTYSRGDLGRIVFRDEKPFRFPGGVLLLPVGAGKTIIGLSFVHALLFESRHDTEGKHHVERKPRPMFLPIEAGNTPASRYVGCKCACFEGEPHTCPLRAALFGKPVSNATTRTSQTHTWLASAPTRARSDPCTRRYCTGAALVVAPARVVSHWLNQARRHTPHMRTYAYRTPKRFTTSHVHQLQDADIVVVSKTLFLREIGRNGHSPLTVRRWKTIVVDEAHTVSSRTLQRACNAMCFDNIWFLSATMSRSMQDDMVQWFSSMDLPVQVRGYRRALIFSTSMSRQYVRQRQALRETTVEHALEPLESDRRVIQQSLLHIRRVFWMALAQLGLVAEDVAWMRDTEDFTPAMREQVLSHFRRRELRYVHEHCIRRLEMVALMGGLAESERNDAASPMESLEMLRLLVDRCLERYKGERGVDMEEHDSSECFTLVRREVLTPAGMHEVLDRGCGMCMCDHDDFVRPLRAIVCGHVFCASCVGRWIRARASSRSTPCPFCRRPWGKEFVELVKPQLEASSEQDNEAHAESKAGDLGNASVCGVTSSNNNNNMNNIARVEEDECKTAGVRPEAVEKRASGAKFSKCVDIILKNAEEGSSTVVHVWHRHTVSRFAKLLRTVLPKNARVLHLPGTNNKNMTRKLADFEEHSRQCRETRHPVVLLISKVSDTGLEFVCSNSLIMINPNVKSDRWVQIRGRLMRPGQTRDVTFHLLRLKDTLDQEPDLQDFSGMAHEHEDAVEFWIKVLRKIV